MVRKARSEERQLHPTGERWTVDDRFKDKLRAWLEHEDMSQADLADKISVVPATITALLKPGRSQSRIVPRVLKLTKWEYVLDETNCVVVIENADAYKRIQKHLPSLSDADKDTVARLVESLATKR